MAQCSPCLLSPETYFTDLCGKKQMTLLAPTFIFGPKANSQPVMEKKSFDHMWTSANQVEPFQPYPLSLSADFPYLRGKRQVYSYTPTFIFGPKTDLHWVRVKKRICQCSPVRRGSKNQVCSPWTDFRVCFAKRLFDTIEYFYMFCARAVK